MKMLEKELKGLNKCSREEVIFNMIVIRCLSGDAGKGQSLAKEFGVDLKYVKDAKKAALALKKRFKFV